MIKDLRVMEKIEKRAAGEWYIKGRNPPFARQGHLRHQHLLTTPPRTSYILHHHAVGQRLPGQLQSGMPLLLRSVLRDADHSCV